MPIIRQSSIRPLPHGMLSNKHLEQVVWLEDDVVVQQTGEPLNLMKNIPIEAEEIEALMNP